jgi:agmatinase
MSESGELPMRFLGIWDDQHPSLDAAKVVILPISYEATVSYGGGTGRGAMEIIGASRHLELYDEETNREVWKIGIHTHTELSAESTPEKMHEVILNRARQLVAPGRILVSIGGDHSISGPLIRAHSEKFSNISVLQIDAHCDLRDSYDGTKLSHASVMRRVSEDMKIPIVQCGIRSVSYSEAKIIPELPVKVFYARDIVGRTDWWEQAVDALHENVYLSIDIDGFDPSLVPETGTPEPGGLGWYEVLGLIRTVARKRKLVGIDLVEYAPGEVAGPGAFIGAKLLYKCLAYLFRGKLEPVI